LRKAGLFVFVLLMGGLALFVQPVFAQQNVSAARKFALVIGNSRYTGINPLTNPVNDANDMEAALRALGFTVDKVLDGTHEQMETAVINLQRRLSSSRNTYGFFFYAGHGVQAGGENYLIPVQAGGIQNESHLRYRALSLQFVLDSLSEAGNELNMVVLDACRDNPFGWGRSGSRGLAAVARAPSGTVVMYAAGAGQQAADGVNQRNGLFTGHLLTNLRASGLSVYQVFDRTMTTVINVTNGSQNPELSLRAGGLNEIFLGSRPVPVVTPAPSSSTNNPELARTHFNRGMVIFNRSEWADAIQEFSTAVRFDPNHAEAFAYRARCHERMGNYDNALFDANNAIQLNPQVFIAYIARGNVYNHRRDYNRGLNDYNEAIRLDPNSAIAYGCRGNSYNGLQDYTRAIADHDQAIRLDPSVALFYYNRGNSYYSLQNYPRAIADYTEAIRLDPNSAITYNNRGNSYNGLQDYTRAIADYTEAIRLNPNYALVYNNRSISYRAIGDTARADADARRARELGYTP